MLQRLFEEQRAQLNHFYEALSLSEANEVFQRLLACKGSLILTGVGKSGHIARKIATTFVSTGTRASFLSPAEALHGDVGAVEENDCLLAFSKSGESDEILQLIPFLEKRGVFRIAIVSRPFSRLSQQSHLTMHLPVERELCPFDLAPTTSTAAQLLFGDCMAMALMQAKGFTVEGFAANHPAGLLGKKLTLSVRDLMRKGEELPICRPLDKLVEVLHELSFKRSGCLLIVEGEELVGVFTDGDLRRALQKEGPGALEKTMGELMNSTFRSIHQESMAVEAIAKMEEDPQKAITILPVIEGKKLVGLLRMHDVLQAGLGSHHRYNELKEICLK